MYVCMYVRLFTRYFISCYICTVCIYVRTHTSKLISYQPCSQYIHTYIHTYEITVLPSYFHTLSLDLSKLKKASKGLLSDEALDSDSYNAIWHPKWNNKMYACMYVCMYHKSSHILYVCMYVCSKGHTYEGTFPNTYMYTQVMRKFILHLTMSQVR